MKICCYISIALLSLSCSIFGQGAPASSPAITPPLPDGPLVRVPANFARWEIKLDYPQRNHEQPGEAGKAAVAVSAHGRKALSVDCTKTNNTGRFVTTYQDGSQMVAYIVGSLQLVTYPEHKDIVYVKDSDQLWCTSKEMITLENYPYFDWINRNAYIGVVEISGVKCFAFQRQENLSNGHVAAKAYVSVDGLWPIAYQAGNVVAKFNHRDPPSKPILLPDDYKKAIDEFRRPTF